MATSTVLSAENVAYITPALQAFMVQGDPWSLDPTVKFLKENFKLMSAESDERRYFKTDVRSTNGTIGLVNNAGVSSGVSFDEVLHENVILRTEKNGSYSLIHRNTGKLRMILNNLVRTPQGVADAMMAMQQMGFDETMRKKIYNKMFADMRTKFAEFLDANDAIDSTDTDFATSGTLFDFNNILTGATIGDTHDLNLINLLNQHTDEDGNKIPLPKPKIQLCKPAYYAQLLQQNNKQAMVNMNYKAPIDYFDGQVLVGDLDTSGNYIYTFAAGHGLVVTVESMDPQFRIGEDEDGNLKINGSMIYGFGFVHRGAIARTTVA